MSKKDRMYRVRFINQDKIYDLFVRSVYQGDMYGFVVLEDFVFNAGGTVVVDPSEERLKSEFEGVHKSIIPMHSIIRIDEVDKRGTARIAELDGKVARFPSPVYTPGGSKS